MEIIKRNGRTVPFDKRKIIKAVENAMQETLKGIDSKISQYIAEQTEEILEGHKNITVEDIQDLIETLLMETPRKDVAKRYILYRSERDKTRHLRKSKYNILTDEFLSKYKHTIAPMNQLGTFTYYRTYSRWINEENRRENWWETVKRAVEYNCSLANTTKEEAEQLYDNVFNLKQFLSGRSFWIGGTEVAEKYPLGNFNCAFVVIDNIQAIRDLFYLLMLGTGVGNRILLHSDATKLPKFKTNLKIIHQDYIPYPQEKRIDHTSVHFLSNDTAELVIGDSKEGWADSLYHYLNICSNKMYRKVDKLIINYNHVRPKGAKLKTFGGTASGHESIKTMFYKIDKVINRNTENEYAKLKPIEVIDVCNAVGENVVVGGVRRTSQNCLVSPFDTESIQAKNNLYIKKGQKWVENKDISHRKMSNNSIFYEEKPTKEQLHWHMQQIKHSGEPGFVNVQAAKERYANFEGLNPCFTGDMQLLTIDGYKTFKELVNTEPYIININGEIIQSKVWCSGEKEVYEIKRGSKKSIKCTSDHTFMLNDGSESSAIDLQHKRLMPFLKLPLHNELMLKLGFIQGDGSLSRLKSKTHLGLEVHFGNNDQDVQKLFNYYDKRYYTTEFTNILIEKEFSQEILPNRELPINIKNWNKNDMRSFISGLYSANGSILTSGRITLKSTCKNMLLQLQTLLKDFDINTYITTNKTKNVKFPNGEYVCKESYDLNIQEYESRLLFYNNINFIQKYKQEKLQNILIQQSPMITSVKSLKRKELVYDFIEPKTHWGVVEGFIAHNCFEILLPSKGVCNLVTLNVYNFLKDKKLAIEELKIAQRLNVRAAYRMSLVELELNDWDVKNKEDKLIGSSLTGWQDMVNEINLSQQEQKDLLLELWETAFFAAEEISKELNDKQPDLITTIKPEGTLSLLPGVSPGLHYSHSPYYIRRVRISANDPLVKVCEELEYPIYPETNEKWETCMTKVIEFPVKSAAKRTKYDITAIEQLENYKMFMQYYVDHNASITVTVKEYEWEEVEEWIWNNWECIIAISFLSLTDSFYELMPYENITQEEYEERARNMRPFIPSLLNKYETEESELDTGNLSDCEGGTCSIR